MRNFVQILYPLIILSSINKCHSKEEKVYKMIFETFDATKGSILLVQSDRPNETKQLIKFSKTTSDFTIFKNHLYIVVRSLITNAPEKSDILQCKITNPTDLEVDQSCKKFDSQYLNEYKTFMTIAGKYLFLVGKGNIILRCHINTQNSCENFTQVNTTISGISYYPFDNKIYISSWSGSILRCSPKDSNSCKEIHKFDGELMSLKVAYGAIWFSTRRSHLEKYQLHRCSFEHPNGCCEPAEVQCQHFDDFGFANRTDTDVSPIVAADRFLFVNVDPRSLWRCDPRRNFSCAEYLSSPAKSMVFSIV